MKVGEVWYDNYGTRSTAWRITEINLPHIKGILLWVGPDVAERAGGAQSYMIKSAQAENSVRTTLLYVRLKCP